MRILKCAKLDFMKSRSMVAFFIFFAVLCGFVAIVVNMPASWAVLYMVFGGLTVVTTPFTVMANMTPAFTEILPARVEEKVFGRFLFGSGVMAASALVGCAVQALVFAMNGENDWTGIFPMIAVLFGASLFFMAVEYVIFYMFGISNAQIVQLVRIVPPFLLFFGGSYLLSALTEDGIMETLLLWMADHQALLAFGAVGAGLLIAGICAAFCCAHEKKKE
ncbi:MAG: ABC-2 transporter permease [Eubacteriales bacterium]|nr:ABC-2 transporter permease [Eubacteriales bacterium]